MHVPVNAVIYSNFVRYDRLNKILYRAYRNSNADHMNIYFDIYPILRSVYTTGDREIIVENTVDIAAGIINLCAHYRSYFRGFGVETTFYLVCGYNCPAVNNDLYHNYNRVMVNRLASKAIMNNTVESNIKMLRTICPYLPDIHFIYTEYETSVCIAGIIKMLREKGDTDPNLVISKDEYGLQLPMICENTVILRPKKKYIGDTNSSDESFIILDPIGSDSEKDIFWHTYYRSRGTSNYDVSISPSNVSLLTALSSYKDRSIDLLIMINKARELIRSMGAVEFCNSQEFYNFNHEYLEKKNITLDTIQRRHRVLDIAYQLESFYLQSGELQAMKFENKVDPNSLRTINEKYFDKNPLDLDRL